ncbi:hypothetical protein B6N60_04890 [Richelia sinica FACHB-800]|uniref:Uncharacterized protein n=1 Tax=Richelia sinica FACHB-800 TaxID=1357546 RepID=A0A975Y7B8_9NOST|nr:hypothetical protein [Richelia sinica]MBD2666212.1 hypothetical protein [Richelia sinica FACHB-800]QXE26159.1 hypothetical protein B6N60_04890 [Richelia sinica FACHB-800]
MKLFFVPFIATSALITGVTTPVTQAQTPAYRFIERDIAIRNKIQVQVIPGRAIPISFSQTDEKITYILLADPSRLNYTTDADLKSGQATTIFMRVIQPLKFPGSTTTTITNLLVQTVDNKRQKRLYNFDIVRPGGKIGYVGIQIANAIPGQQKLLINKNRRATVDDIETGLRIAINRGYTQHNDPVVAKVRQVIAMLRNSRVTIPDAATSIGVPIEVISELGRISLGENIRQLVQPR